MIVVLFDSLGLSMVEKAEFYGGYIYKISKNGHTLQHFQSVIAFFRAHDR